MDSFFNDYNDFIKLNNKNIEKMSISSLFELENNIVDDMNKLKETSKDLDLIYFNYKTLKDKINHKINNGKELLIMINSQKEYYDKKDIDKKLLFLINEYHFFLNQTNTEKINNIINNLENRINFLKDDLKSRKYTMEYKKIKEQYKNILIFINNKQFDNTEDIVPDNLNNEEKINWYEKSIEKLIQKQMVFDKYIYLLENLYNDMLNKKMLDITFSK